MKMKKLHYYQSIEFSQRLRCSRKGHRAGKLRKNWANLPAQRKSDWEVNNVWMAAKKLRLLKKPIPDSSSTVAGDLIR